MRTLPTLIIGLLLAGAVPRAVAEPVFGNFHERTSLLSIRSLAQDGDGMIWFGTEYCLYSFDGYDLTPYPCPDGRLQINKLLLQPGHLILGTNSGLYFFDLKEERFQRAVPLQDEVIQDLHIDNTFIYAGTKTGFFRYSPETDTAVRIADGNTYAVVQDEDILYVGMQEGLGTFQPGSGVFTPLLQAPLFCSCILPDREFLWVGTPMNLFRIDKSTGQSDSFGLIPVIKSMCRGTDGNLLITTDNGLFRFNPATGTHEAIHPGVVWTSLEDQSGNLWFGTDNGLLILRQNPIIHPAEGLPKDIVSPYSTLLRDRNGRLWAGGSNGIFCVRDNGEVQHYAMSGTPYRIPHNKVRRIVHDPQTDELYFASDGGILRYDEASRQMARIDIAGSQNWIYDLLPLEEELWAATFEGVYRLHKDGTVNARYTQQDGLTSNDIAQICRGRQGRIWALTRDQHVFQIDSDTGTVSALQDISDGADCVCADHEGRIWIAAGNILIRITSGQDGNDIRSTEFYPDPNLEAFSVVEAEDRIWVCTSEGLFSIGADLLDVRAFGTYRNYIGIAYDPGHRSLLLGTAGAVDEIRLDDLQQYYEGGIPPIRVTSIIVNGSRRINGVGLSDGRLALPYNQNHLEIAFSDFDFNDEFLHRFDYTLEGRREHGKGTVTGNKIPLNALRPGRYRLAVAPADIAAAPTEILSFRIRQPWYLSPWMLLFYLGLLGGVIFTIVKLATTRRYLELERAQRDELTEQSRQKAAFFQDLAHELKTPLSLVIGPIGKMIREAGPETDLTDLRIAQENAMRLSALIHHTIDYYKGTGGVADSPMTSDVEFVDFARTIFDTWRDNFPKHEFIFSSSHPSIPVTIDIVKIETVLNNLLSNACKYTPEGGSVLMTLERDDIGRQLVIKVSDTGIGIPGEELPFAFQRYFESSRTKQGGYDSTGIGLSVIKNYVEVHNGQVAVDSDANGTTFTVLLPCLAEGAGVGGRSASEGVDADDTDKPLIAIVDDNAQICNFLESLLKDKYRCVCSHNGKSGLKLCQDVIPDLVISDVRMPVMDGLEMCRQIRQFGPLSTIPIILLTAKDDRETEQQSIDLNIDVFLPKPFEVPTLTARVGQLLGNKKRMEQRIRMEMITSPGTSRELSQDERFMRKVTQLIEEHLDDADLSVARLCELGDFSEKQLYRKLKQFTGLSAVEYIRSIRLKKAALLLQSGKFTVSEVMYSVGFSNASYFTRTFSTAYNMTPSEYMKSFKK